jgi:hypothetical protein
VYTVDLASQNFFPALGYRKMGLARCGTACVSLNEDISIDETRMIWSRCRELTSAQAFSITGGRSCTALSAIRALAIVTPREMVL